MSARRKIIVPASMDYLEDVLQLVRESLGETEATEKMAFSVEIVVEELFTNIASYAYESGAGKATIICEIFDDPAEIQITFEDNGIPYNPLEHKDPDIEADLDDREIGGLGIFMTKKMMDAVEYEFRDGKNILRIRKHIE